VVFCCFAVLEALATVWQLFRFPQTELTGPLGTYVGGLQRRRAVAARELPALHDGVSAPALEGRRRVTSPWWWLVVLAYATPAVMLIAKAMAHVDIKPLELWFKAIAFPLGSLS